MYLLFLLLVLVLFYLYQFTTLILDSIHIDNFIIPFFQFLLQNFKILTLSILYFHLYFILTFMILILSL